MIISLILKQAIIHVPRIILEEPKAKVGHQETLVTVLFQRMICMPIIYPLLLGREKDTHQIFLRVARAHIVNINGAPGFGKSTLAIHVGYEKWNIRSIHKYGG